MDRATRGPVIVSGLLAVAAFAVLVVPSIISSGKGPAVLMLLGGVLVLVGGLVAVVRMQRSSAGGGASSPVTCKIDDCAQYMPSHREVEQFTAKAVKKTALRLSRDGFDPKNPATWGLDLGTLVPTRHALMLDFESCIFVVAGMRRGKSQAFAIPWTLDGPGAVIVTSNKIDVYRETSVLRRRAGHREWLFDLQDLTGSGAPEIRFDPFEMITDLETAMQAAGHFVSSVQKKGATAHSYFDNAGVRILAAYMLAASLIGGDLLHVARWLDKPRETLAAEILIEYGFSDLGSQVKARNQLDPRQQEGFFDPARMFIEAVVNPKFARWVVPEERGVIARHPETGKHIVKDVKDSRPVFKAAEFVRSTDTLYALSQHGEGSPAPLVTALVGIVIETARTVANREQGGRLKRPIIAILDEVANICRLKGLPNMMSYCGSIGVVLAPILQSKTQGENIWGDEFTAAWNSANAVAYLGGNRDDELEREISARIGDQDKTRENKSYSSGSTNYSENTSREPIMPPELVGELPKGRGILLASGCRPVVIAPSMAYQSKRAGEIDAAKKEYDASHRVRANDLEDNTEGERKAA
ncbi:type IV secretory system conjugative DNA transfer family protein [Tsukamurella paurometabola]|uniref:Conjugal transfer protein n=1 Tax=Tsukamurella paurometabola (strain ATCC 8368 / DSM 20162 / CCUG 35730 / CIP 100753 / JCM 10117 / KCTC 9821 / NBRC 16120 / NCIMB 702349 / NCTC 13040) TaxID=521096 RepID=D5UQT0_TSUPD|nr:TraM recognition domain-containing protein [Tsukamurella paurometabola]ADG76913.1 conjugal transfer protein [Tsukamurella paurometabola DSM 20162]SUP42178.1 conjugal transfer coupling protein TraG [Tsukamurella paurometabola]